MGGEPGGRPVAASLRGRGSQIATRWRSRPATPRTRAAGRSADATPRDVRGARLPWRRHRGCASRNLTGWGARRHTDARRPPSATSPDASPGDGDQAGLACGRLMGAGPALLRAAAQPGSTGGFVGGGGVGSGGVGGCGVVGPAGCWGVRGQGVRRWRVGGAWGGAARHHLRVELRRRTGEKTASGAWDAPV